ATLPEPVHAPYIAPPSFDFLTALGAAPLVDGPSFMEHAVAVWQISEHPHSRVLAPTGGALTDAGWSVGGASRMPDYLRATKGQQVIELFPADEPGANRTQDAPGANRTQDAPGANRTQAARPRVGTYVMYVHSATAENPQA